MPKNYKLLVVLVGPTAIGKTKVAIELATLFNTEIISADSRQFFRELNIGTAKPSDVELKQVNHHFINSLSVSEAYDAGKYEQEANALILHLFKKYDILIMAGGSGMYIDAVCNGFDELPTIDPEIRKQLTKKYQDEGILSLQNQLKELDPDHSKKVDMQNPQRVIRALEICLGTGKPYSSFLKNKNQVKSYRILKIGLNIAREKLYHQINERVDRMIMEGLADEVKTLIPYKKFNALQTVGYKELIDFFGDKADLSGKEAEINGDKTEMNDSVEWERTIELIKKNTRNYAKRQLTWFKKDTDTTWFEPNQTKAIIDYLSNHQIIFQ